MDPSNSYFTMFELAKDLDVKKSHIRFCEENGLIPPRVSKLKRRVYNRYDRERLKLVFHFVLLGYSKEQIVDLIGIPDANLDENDQLMQGIEHSSRELKKLEKRKEELSFTKQTRIINEIEMLREYLNKIEIIKSGVLEGPPARPSIRFEDKARKPTKPVMAITSGAGKKTIQDPVKTISLFVAGLALVILIGSYFYYQTGQKETKTIKPVQKKPIHSEKFRVPQATVPVNQIAKTQAAVEETQELTPSSSDSQQGSLKVKSSKASPGSTQTVEMAPVTGGVPLIRQKERLDSPKVEEAVKDNVRKEIAVEGLKEKAVPDAASEETLTAAVPGPVKEKAMDIEVKETSESESAEKALPIADDASLTPDKENSDIHKVEDPVKDDVSKELAIDDLSEKAALATVGGDTLTSAQPKPVKEKATDIEIKEISESESAAKALPIAGDVSLTLNNEKLDIPKAEKDVKDDVQKEVDAEKLKEKAVPDAAGEETLTAAAPEHSVEKVAETEVKPSLTESEKEMKQITPKEDIHQQKNELSRLKSFLDEYCQAYTNKDLDKFKTFFTSDATENNKPFHGLLPDYRKNMESRESITYRIELLSYSKQTASENLMIRGRFFTRYQSQKGVWKENNGSIFMELIESGDSFLVKQLNY